MKSVGAAVLEIQLGLCRRGGKGIGFGARGTGVGAKRVCNRGLLHFRMDNPQSNRPFTYHVIIIHIYIRV